MNAQIYKKKYLTPAIMTGLALSLTLGLGVSNSNAQTGKSLDRCQKAVGKETGKYINSLSSTVGKCLQAASTNVLAKGKTAGDAVRTCVSQLTRIKSSAAPDRELGGKFEGKIGRYCDPSTNTALVHSDSDIYSIGQATISAGNLNEFCMGFGGDGSIDSASEWSSCLRSAAECQAHQTIAIQYPRALEYFEAIETAISSLPSTSDTTDALSALAAIDSAIEGPKDDNLPELNCGASICGNGRAELGEACDGGDFSGTTCASLGFLSGNLSCSGCMIDASACTGGGISASGQTFAYGSGSDGDVLAGQPLAFSDNGDGTITDLGTALMWEKKDDSGGLHDHDNTYTWCKETVPVTGFCNFGSNMDGSVVNFIDTLNDVAGGGSSCFANYCDWRVPNVRELTSMTDYGETSPAVDAIFHDATNCSGCSDVTAATCTCTATASFLYWSSTTHGFDDESAWATTFYDGSTIGNNKLDTGYLRAVRTGP